MLNTPLPHGKHTLTSYLPHVEHAVHTCLYYLLLLFKLVVVRLRNVKTKHSTVWTSSVHTRGLQGAEEELCILR
jgi:hypothetical protein